MCAMGIVGRLNRSGMEACREGKYDEAEGKLLAALQVAQARGGGCTVIKVHNNLGIVYELQGRHEMARRHYRNALDLLETTASGGHPMHDRLTRCLDRIATAGFDAV